MQKKRKSFKQELREFKELEQLLCDLKKKKRASEEALVAYTPRKMCCIENNGQPALVEQFEDDGEEVLNQLLTRRGCKRYRSVTGKIY